MSNGSYLYTICLFGDNIVDNVTQKQPVHRHKEKLTNEKLSSQFVSE